jgi:hypothetical protein
MSHNRSTPSRVPTHRKCAVPAACVSPQSPGGDRVTRNRSTPSPVPTHRKCAVPAARASLCPTPVVTR